MTHEPRQPDPNCGVRVTVTNLDSDYHGTFGTHGKGDGQYIWPSAITGDSQGRGLAWPELPVPAGLCVLLHCCCPAAVGQPAGRRIFQGF